MAEIEFSVKNIKRCLCPECPVQAENECVEGKKRIMAQIAWSSEIGIGYIFEPDRIPGLYCGTGKAICHGLNKNKSCQCNKCLVWHEYNLENEEPHFYFCLNGKNR